MRCVRCAKEIPVASAFCNHCGAAQSGETPHAAASGAARAGPARVEDDVWSGVYSARAMGLAQVGAGLWFVLLWVAYFWLRARCSYVAERSWILWMLLVLSPAPALWVSAIALWRKLTLRYRLTTQRFFVTRGLIARRTEEIELVRIDDVATNQGVMERIFDVGTVTLMSTDTRTPHLDIQGIHEPVVLKERIRSLVQETRKRVVTMESV